MGVRESDLFKELMQFLGIPYYESYFNSTFYSLGITVDDYMSFIYSKDFSEEDKLRARYFITDPVDNTLAEVLSRVAGFNYG